MSLTVVGSIAYDAVKTPFGERERMLGGAATHFALAASFFDEVRVVGPVGGDFTEEDFAVLRTRGTITDDVEVVPDGKTFFWAGEYGAALITEEGFFALPAYPLEVVIDPTGAGDTFAGGLAGYVAAHPGEPVSHDLLTRAIAYGTALASFNVEEFGTERVARLTADEVAARVADLQRMTRFELAPLTLRG